MEYNYVICGSDGFYDVAYHDIKGLPNVQYHSSMYSGVEGWLTRKIVRLTFSKKVNQYISTPFSRFSFGKILPFHFKDDKPLCFVFFYDYFTYLTPIYFKFLRKKYPNAKLVLYLQDIIASRQDYDVNGAREVFDLIISYDKGDSAKYGLSYYPTPFSNVVVPHNDNIPSSDVYFCGKAKTRYNEIFDWYHKLTSWGLKCDFNIIELEEDKRIYGEGITYCKGLSYIENLQHVQKTKCILEIMQEGADGFTPRLWESIMYDKFLLTNNDSLKQSKYGSIDGIRYSRDLSEDFVNDLCNELKYTNETKNSLSPTHLLEFIECSLK